MRGDKPTKLFIYIPMCIGEKFIDNKSVKMPYYDIRVGDIFSCETNTGKYTSVDASKDLKVESVRFNLNEKACIVILEKKKFKDEKELNRFKNSISNY